MSRNSALDTLADRPILGRLGKLINFIYRKHPWIFHLGFWAVYFFLSSIILSEIFSFPKAMLRSSVIISLQAVLVYVNFFLLNRLLFRNQVTAYFVTLPVAWIIIGVFRAFIESNYIGRNLLGVTPFSSQHIVVIFISSFLILVVTSFALFVDDWYQKRMEAQELEAAKLEAELRFLQSQVNPHFLFNVLNMIYTQAFTKSEQTAATVMKLSEMMRYMLEATKKDKVKLSEEVSYLERFIEMQDLKKGRKQEVKLEIEGNIGEVKLEPMLFIPFLENAYKHGNVSLESTGWVKARLEVLSDQINFEITNSLGKTQPKKDGTGGVGLENIRKRLQLLYPGRHELTVKESPEKFQVKVVLHLGKMENK